MKIEEIVELPICMRLRGKVWEKELWKELDRFPASLEKPVDCWNWLGKNLAWEIWENLCEGSSDTLDDHVLPKHLGLLSWDDVISLVMKMFMIMKKKETMMTMMKGKIS